VQAFTWYKRFADLGDQKAMAYVDWMYCTGIGVTTNLGLGAARLGEVAALGSDWACYALGRVFQNGSFGFHKNEAEAAVMYAKIPSCTIKNLSVGEGITAAEWLREYRAQPTTRPAN
jgi:TPR repeat protein